MSICIIGGGSTSKSLLFNGSNYLSMTDSTWGVYDRTKFAISVWFSTTSFTNAGLIQKGALNGTLSGDGTNSLVFSLGLDTGTVDLRCSSTGANINNGRFLSTHGTLSGSDYNHALFHWQVGSPTRCWINGTEDTLSTAGTPTAPLPDNGSHVEMGTFDNGATLNGKLYQCAFFSGNLPAINDVWSSSGARDVTSIPGLWSLINDPAGSVTADIGRSANWTNTGSVTNSTDIPP
jgi:hypothetical protein